MQVLPQQQSLLTPQTTASSVHWSPMGPAHTHQQILHQQPQPQAEQVHIQNPRQLQQQVYQPQPQPLQQQPPQQLQQPLQSKQEPAQPYDTTPSSPDDEHGRSSYEAISKMLTMLRNSANSSGEIINDADPRLKGQQGVNILTQQHSEQQQADPESISLDTKPKYSLIPVEVYGIDYTRYKLLSQYEPKFKSDPRLNQQL